MSRSLKSFLYGTLKCKYIYYIFIGLLILPFFTIFINQINAVKPQRVYEIISLMEYSSLFAFPFMGMSFALILAVTMDFDNKTAYYELTGGNSRKAVFLSRIIPAMIFGIVGSFILYFVPYLAASFVWGFGNSTELTGTLVRLGLAVLIMMRQSAFLCLACFCTRKLVNGISALGLSAVVYIISEAVGFKESTLSATMNLFRLTTFDTESVYNISQKGIIAKSVCIAMPDTSFIVKTIIMSVLFTAFYLFLAWRFFKADDIQ